MNLIVTRHSGAIDWLQNKKNIKGEVIPHIDINLIPSGIKNVYGIIPIHISDQLIRRGIRVYIILMPELPAEMRGQELTSEMMSEFGAKLLQIKKLELKEI